MIENCSDKIVLNALAPDLLRQHIVLQNLECLFSRKNMAERASEEMDIHLGCVKNNGGEVIGSVSLKENLSSYQGSYVYILAGYDRCYGFELYLNDKQTEVLGVMIVRLRTKSENEVQWEKERLGIKHP